MPHAIFESVWLGLFAVISTARTTHERKAGRRSSMKGIPILEATAMLLWGLAAGVLPLVYIFSPWLDGANWPFDMPVGLGGVGAALFVGAIWLVHRSHTDLGTQWSPTVDFKDNHSLAARGRRGDP